MANNASCDVLDRSPISIVIPTISKNPGILATLCAALLRTPPMRFVPGSEIVINHGTVESYAQRDELERIVGDRTHRWLAANLSTKLVHVYGPRAELFAGTRASPLPRTSRWAPFGIRT